ncbi:MAG: general secretion pathway protein GspK [Xanthomonadales bacterium]|nr:general secretion pathway protein GspK [Xanthomonadales bacterium]
MRRSDSPRSGRGIALVFVLWVLALLTLLLASFALVTRTESLQSRHLFDSTRARYAAEAGINQAAWSLSLPDPVLRWLPDGREYRVEFEEADISIRITDESGLIDLNAAEPPTLTNLFVGVGVDPIAAAALADAILDWRDGDDLKLLNGAEDADYRAEGYPYGAKDAPFDLVGELEQVMGMTPELYRQVAPALTVYSGQAVPNLAYAPIEVIRAFPNIDPTLAQLLIEQRHAWLPGLGLPPPTLPDGTPLVAEGGTGTYSIESRATLPNGAFTELRVTLRLGGSGISGRAFSVLRWQDTSAL